MNYVSTKGELVRIDASLRSGESIQMASMALLPPIDGTQKPILIYLTTE